MNEDLLLEKIAREVAKTHGWDLAPNIVFKNSGNVRLLYFRSVAQNIYNLINDEKSYAVSTSSLSVFK